MTDCIYDEGTTNEQMKGSVRQINLTALLKVCMQLRRHSEELAGERQPDGEGVLGQH